MLCARSAYRNSSACSGHPHCPFDRCNVFCAQGSRRACSRLELPLAPTRLFDFDAANFALALLGLASGHGGSPTAAAGISSSTVCQASSKVIHLLVEDVQLTFLIAGLLGAAAAILMLWILGERLFGPPAGILSALLAMTNPILWQTA